MFLVVVQVFLKDDDVVVIDVYGLEEENGR